MEIRENVIAISCDICGMDTKNVFELEEYNNLVICDKCMQEANRTIVNYLADKNI